MDVEIPMIISTGELEGVAGDDAYLKYYYQCTGCKTVVIVDNSKMQPLIKDYKCPSCFPEQKDFPFDFVQFNKIKEYKVPAPFVSFFGDIEKTEISLEERLEIGFI